MFRETQLRDYVRQPAVMKFLKAYGYQDTMSIMEMLEHLRYRMEASVDFPHEIGVFLGYPLKDVNLSFLVVAMVIPCAANGRFTTM